MSKNVRLYVALIFLACLLCGCSGGNDGKLRDGTYVGEFYGEKATLDIVDGKISGTWEEPSVPVTFTLDYTPLKEPQECLYTVEYDQADKEGYRFTLQDGKIAAHQILLGEAVPNEEGNRYTLMNGSYKKYEFAMEAEGFTLNEYINFGSQGRRLILGHEVPLSQMEDGSYQNDAFVLTFLEDGTYSLEEKADFSEGTMTYAYEEDDTLVVRWEQVEVLRLKMTKDEVTLMFWGGEGKATRVQ